MDIKNDGYLHEIAFNTNGDKMVICSSSQKDYQLNPHYQQK